MNDKFQNMLLRSGDLYVATNFDSSKILDSAWSDLQKKDWFEQHCFESVGFIKDFQETHSLDDEKKITADNCGVGDIDVQKKRIPKLSFTWLEVNDIELMARILGLDVTSNASTTSQTATQTISEGDWDTSVCIGLVNNNCDLSLITPTSVVGSVTGALATPADYSFEKDASGRTIVTITNAAIPTTQDIVITYSYTPCVSQLTGYQTGYASQPLLLYRFVSCEQKGEKDTTTGLYNYTRNTVYFSKFYLDSEFVRSFVNLSNNDFEGASFEFTGGEGGYWYTFKEFYQK